MPGTSLFIVVVAVSDCEKEPGPVTVTAAFTPPGSPLIVTVSEPVEIAYVTVFDALSEPTASVAVWLAPPAYVAVALLTFDGAIV